MSQHWWRGPASTIPSGPVVKTVGEVLGWVAAFGVVGAIIWMMMAS